MHQFKSYSVVILGDFNVRSKSKDITSNKGSQTDSLTSTYRLQQLISDPTFILLNPSTCIDLMFTEELNLDVESGVHPSLHTNCHHQITYCKFNLVIE